MILNSGDKDIQRNKDQFAAHSHDCGGGVGEAETGCQWRSALGMDFTTVHSWENRELISDAANQHDNDRITFHRLKDFRKTAVDLKPDPAPGNV